MSVHDCERYRYQGVVVHTKAADNFRSGTKSYPPGAGGEVGGGVLPYMGYIGTCRGIGYGFLGSRSLNRVSFFGFGP